MKKGALFVKVLMAFLALTLVSGCNDGGPSTQVFVKKPSGQQLRIAVLPFENVSKDQEAGRVLTNTVITYLLSTGGFDVLEPGVVYSAMQSGSVRLTEGITQQIAQKLQPELNVDAYVVGVVEEYGEVRVGADTYPSISFSARLVDARTADILWAATISKTGAEGVKVFDIGRISSLGKLSKLAVSAMAKSMFKSTPEILLGLKGTAAPTQTVGNATVQPAVVKSGVPGESPAAAAAHGQGTTGGTPRYLDEAATYGEVELRQLLKDTGNAKLGEVAYKKHFHDAIDARYQLNDGGKLVDVRLVDYRTKATAEKFLQSYHKGQQPISFESVPAYTDQSDFGYYHLDIAVGRFGVFLSGPKDLKSGIEQTATGIVAGLK